MVRLGLGGLRFLFLVVWLAYTFESQAQDCLIRFETARDSYIDGRIDAVLDELDTSGLNCANPSFYCRRKCLGKRLHMIELNIVFPLTGETINGVGITDLFERLRHQD